MYRKGESVEKDKKKEVDHLEEAAIGGHANARHNLGVVEGRNGRFERSIKHFIISAKLGLGAGLENVKEGFKMGLVSKEDFAATLRTNQAVLDEMRSPQREAADTAQIQRHMY